MDIKYTDPVPSVGGGVNKYTYKHEYMLNKEERICRNVPALTGEKFVTTLDDYYFQVNHQLVRTNFNGHIKAIISSWESLSSELNLSSKFGAYIKKRPFKNLAKELENKSSKEKIAYTYEHVRSLLDWNEDYGIYAKNGIASVLKNKKGSIAEINLALVAALKASEVEAYPVILSTRSNGKTHPVLPLLENYNYVIAIAYYDDKAVLLDASSNHVSLGQLPFRCLNYIGRIVKDKTCEQLMIEPNEGFVSKETGMVKILENGNLDAKVRRKYKGYESLSVKKQTNSESSKEKYKEKIEEEYSDWEIENINVKNGKTSIVTIIAKKESDEEDADLIYINPFVDKTKNYFQQENRLHPVDIGATFYDYKRYSYQIPTNYVVDELPESVKYLLPNSGGSFAYTIKQNGSMIQLVSVLDLKKVVYYDSEYAYLREIFNKAIAKQGEQIVLKRKED